MPSASWGRCLRSVLAMLLLAPVLLALAVSPASAHAGLLGSDPQAGAQLPAAPKQVRLEFTEAINPEFTSVRMTIAGRYAPSDAVVAGGVVTVTPRKTDPQRSPSRWVMAYRVVSEDGHPVVGTVRFVVEPPSKGASPSPTDRSSPSSDPTPASGSGSDAVAPATSPAEPNTGPGPGQIIADVFILVLAIGGFTAAVLWVVRGRRQDRGQ